MIRLQEARPSHPKFYAWCELSLMFTRSKRILELFDIIFEKELTLMSDGVRNEFGTEKFSPADHKRFYQSALKSLNCKDFGLQQFHCREDAIWYTAMLGTFFNDVFQIADGDEEALDRNIKPFQAYIDNLQNSLEGHPDKYQMLVSNQNLWKQISTSRCQVAPRALDLYKDLATFLLDTKVPDLVAFDFSAHFLKPFYPQLKNALEDLLPVDPKNKANLDNIFNKTMDHFFPILKEINAADNLKNAEAVKLFIIYVLKGFILEWKAYNKWSIQMRNYDSSKELADIDLDFIKNYFQVPFEKLPSNLMAVIWKNRLIGKGYSEKVPSDIRLILTKPHYEFLPSEVMGSILKHFENLTPYDLDLKKFYSQPDPKQGINLKDIEETEDLKNIEESEVEKTDDMLMEVDELPKSSVAPEEVGS